MYIRALHTASKSRAKRIASSMLALTTAAGLLAACSSASETAGEDGPIVVGSILDETGDLNIYGEGKKKATELAIEQINADGGLLGRQVELRSYDTQSSLDNYSQFANQLALKDKPAIVHGGITSSSREAIRPIFDRTKTLYTYGNIYEGGVCDGNMFVTGPVPSQQISALIPYAMKEFGKRVYIVAADYNFGQIEAEWIKKYVTDAGGEVLGTDFVPMASSDFGSVISNIQRAQPDFVVSIVVGTNHMAFYRAFAATGLKATTPLVSTTFNGAEKNMISPAEAQGIVTAGPYFPALDNPVNKEFLSAWEAKFGPDNTITDADVSTYNAWMMWAAAVEKAGTTDRDAVIKAYESGISIDAPSGLVTMDGPSHQVVQPISIATVDAAGDFTISETVEAVEPTFEQEKCNLIDDPAQNEVFVPSQ